MSRLTARAILGWLPAVLLTLTVPAQAHIYDVATRDDTTLPAMLKDLGTVRLVFIGELHDNAGHHQAQLQVIRALHEAGVPVTIGLEMFRRDSQGALDLWTKGSLSEPGFEKIFAQNWSLWPLYRDIFRFARQAKIPMIGLNIRRNITEQVAKAGFGSLSAEQRGDLPLVRCDVAPEYQAYIRRVLGEHVHNGVMFRNFCEAQMVWDVVTAVS